MYKAVQNRNQHVTAALAYVVKMCYFKTVSINFLEAGHIQVECDSMHSAIECEKRNTYVFSLDDWLNVFKINVLTVTLLP